MHFVDGAGARVAYRVEGRGPGIVLVHGTAGDGETHWGAVAERLAARWTVVRPDYAGSGATVDGGRALSVAGLAAQVSAAAEAAGLERFHLLGFSLGAVVAVQVAAEHPERVRALVTLGGFVSGADSRFQMMLRFWRGLIDRDREALARHWLLTGFSPAFLSSLTPELLEESVAQSLGERDWDGVRRQIDLDLALDIGAAARRVATPTLVVGCRQDQMVPPALARALAALIPGAGYAELDCGHAAPLECPDALVRGGRSGRLASVGATPAQRRQDDAGKDAGKEEWGRLAMARQHLPLWQRLLITVLVMLGASYLVALVWNAVLGFALPSYAAGLVGGLAAIPVWDLLQRIRPKS